MPEQITSFRGKYKFLSNFAHTPFRVPLYRTSTGNEYVFKTVEHFFQACKAQHELNAQKIINAKTPRSAKTIGNWDKLTIWDDWDEIKNNVMLMGLSTKFRQHADLANKLLETGDAVLIEGNTWNDRYWGMVALNGASGVVWVGENHLGKLLMQVRQELRG